MQHFEKKLYSELIARKHVPEDTLQKVLAAAEASHRSLADQLISDGLMKEKELSAVLSDIAHIPMVNLKKETIDPEALAVVPVKFAWHYKFVPLKVEGKRLTIAVYQPLTLAVQDELRLILGYTIVSVLSRREHVEELLKVHYGLGSDTVDQMITADDGKRLTTVMPQQEDIQDIEKRAEDASVIKLVNQIILEAYRRRATDIHIEPFRGQLKLRYRIDGMLHDQKVSHDVSQFLMPILSRIKIMSNLDIIERRVPQDGRAIVKTQDQVLDLRVSFIPTPHGESVVIRILPTKMFFSLEKLGYAHDDLIRLTTLIRRPNGIIFVTGPTGSGKTTTLYACIKEMDSTRRKVITIEDPIEYEMDGITQIQVNPTVGLTFAAGLRSMLRHDPDVIMVGEVRDRETAEIAIRVALTGHLVLSTLHTNDAASGVMRLCDIGIEPYLIASSVEAFVAQRLVRVICPACKQLSQHTDAEIRKAIAQTLELGFDDTMPLYKGSGCEECSGTGFFGRTAIYELLMVDEQIKRLITDKAIASVIHQHAINQGMKTMLRDGWEKVLAGVTTPEEVLHVCQDLELATVLGAGRSEESAQGSPTHVHVRQGSHYPDEKRLYMRMPQRIPVQYRLIEKGKGDIIKVVNETKHTKKTSGSVLLDTLHPVNEVSSDGYDELYVDAFTATTNISAGGLVFESAYAVPVGSIIELKIHLSGENLPIRCFSKVLRCEDASSECCYVAVCFLDLAGVDRTRINHFIETEFNKQHVVDLDTA